MDLVDRRKRRRWLKEARLSPLAATRNPPRNLPCSVTHRSSFSQRPRVNPEIAQLPSKSVSTDSISIGLDLSSTFRSPGSPGSGFGTEIDTTAETSWASQFDEPPTMAATTGTGEVPAPKATPAADNISVGQRMLSATAGNILTGLLGELRAEESIVNCRFPAHSSQSPLWMSFASAYNRSPRSPTRHPLPLTLLPLSRTFLRILGLPPAVVKYSGSETMRRCVCWARRPVRLGVRHTLRSIVPSRRHSGGLSRQRLTDYGRSLGMKGS